LIPNLAVQSCLLMNDTLTSTQSSNCSHLAMRSISPFYRADPPGFVSGANILDMSRIGIDYALRVNNATLVAEGFSRIHAQLVVEPGVKIDGIKPDGRWAPLSSSRLVWLLNSTPKLRATSRFIIQRQLRQRLVCGLSAYSSAALSFLFSVNAVLNLEEAASGTRFASDDSERSIFSTLIDADKWMVVYNTVTGVLHWDLVSC
jgi:hypothetical protein